MNVATLGEHSRLGATPGRHTWVPGLTVAPYVPRECGGHPGVEPDASDAEVRKAYRQAAKRNHPDKGGDADVFRGVQEAFEVLRGLFEAGGIGSFASALNTAAPAGSTGPKNAYQRTFTKLDMNALFSEPAPTNATTAVTHA